METESDAIVLLLDASSHEIQTNRIKVENESNLFFINAILIEMI
jgi:hypothetical protein